MIEDLIDEETKLQMINQNHAQSLFSLVDSNRFYLRQWLPWLDSNVSILDSYQYIAAIQNQFLENTGFVYCIWYREEIVGVIGHNRIDWEQKIAWPGYWLAQLAQGRGIMTKCCRFLVDYSFNCLDLERIEIHCATGNEKSRAIPERLNFRQQRIVKQAEWLYDQFVDHIIYGMRKADW